MPALADELKTSGFASTVTLSKPGAAGASSETLKAAVSAVYCPIKAYVLSLGEAIAYELRDGGITVITLCPVPRQCNLPRKLNLRQRGCSKEA